MSIEDIEGKDVENTISNKASPYGLECNQKLKVELPEYEIPYESDIRIIDKIPYTKLGKVDFRWLEDYT